MNSVGGRLKAARIARGLTQEQLARGFASKGFISLVERDRLNPSLPKLRLRAVQWLDRATPGDQDLRARLYTNLANDSYRLGEVQQAITYLQKALRAATDAESLLRMANAHMALGITARAAGNLEQALKHCD